MNKKIKQYLDRLKEVGGHCPASMDESFHECHSSGEWDRLIKMNELLLEACLAVSPGHTILVPSGYFDMEEKIVITPQTQAARKAIEECEKLLDGRNK